jgi:hypothetical protein
MKPNNLRCLCLVMHSTFKVAHLWIIIVQGSAQPTDHVWLRKKEECQCQWSLVSGIANAAHSPLGTISIERNIFLVKAAPPAN